MDQAAIERFSGPPLAERAWVSEQARACVVRPGTDDLETLVRRDVRDSVDELRWDSWRRPDGRWTVVAALGEDSPVSTWVYDPRSRSVQPDDAASHRLASEDVVVPLRPSSATVSLPRDEAAPSRRNDAAPHASDEIDEAPATSDGGEPVEPLGAEPQAPDTDVPGPTPADVGRAKSRKGRRASVPRWDEILFGAGQSDT